MITACCPFRGMAHLGVEMGGMGAAGEVHLTHDLVNRSTGFGFAQPQDEADLVMGQAAADES